MPEVLEIERRYRPFKEFRIEGDAQNPKIIGYPIMFNQLSDDLGGFREQIDNRTFDRNLSEIRAGNRNVYALFNHDALWALADIESGRLKLTKDDNGIHMEAEPVVTPLNDHVIKLIAAKVIKRMSFGFLMVKDTWNSSNPKRIIRTLLDADLLDVSPVTFPAYPQTSVKVRDYINALKELDEKGTLIPSESNLEKLRLNYGYKIK